MKALLLISAQFTLECYHVMAEPQVPAAAAVPAAEALVQAPEVVIPEQNPAPLQVYTFLL